MTATADMILERRRVRRALAFWRIAAVLAVLALVIVALPLGGGDRRGEHVARISVDGLIRSDQRRAETLADIAGNDSVRALIVRVNSPGGTVAGSEALYDSLRRVAEAKPVAVAMNEVAASGGYLAALAGEHIIARQTTMTGSIGVVAQVPNVSDLLDSIGVEVREVKSAPLKAAPSTTQPVDERAVEALEATIMDSFDWFRGLVAERRGLEGADLEAVTDGRVFTGRQALDLGLVDALGAPRDARTWLESAHGIAADTRIVDYSWTRPELPFPFDQLEGWLGPFWPSAGGLAEPGPRLMAVLAG